MIEISKIEEILPQTQCRQCGYHDCADYAKAIAVGEKHNRCPAGGPQVISRLSALLGREELSLNEECGVHVPPEIAEIDPNKCIGLSSLLGCLSHGRHHRLAEAYALCGRRTVQRLLSLPARLPRRLHFHGPY